MISPRISERKTIRTSRVYIRDLGEALPDYVMMRFDELAKAGNASQGPRDQPPPIPQRSALGTFVGGVIDTSSSGQATSPLGVKG